jgi:DNA replication and repair protein RecF
LWLRRLTADRLRNLKAVSVDLASGLTVVTGRNGQGKTSLLEAAYLLGTGHSFRTRRSEELVSRDGGPLRVSGDVSRRSGEERLAVVLEKNERRLLAGGSECDLEHFLGRLDLVALPGDAPRVLRDGPDGRRRFLDRGIVGVQPAFLRTLGEYRRILAERNALLKARGRDDASRRRELGAWDERLVGSAGRLHRERRTYATALASRLGEVERALFPDGETFALRYLPSPDGAAEVDPTRFPETYLERLERERSRDLALGFTGSGPHRDDFALELDGIDLRRFGSGGQVRAAMVALSVAKLGFLRESRGESPLFLMDDFDSDLDEPRGAALAEYLHSGSFQAVLVTAKEGLADRLTVPSLRIRMENGGASKN